MDFRAALEEITQKRDALKKAKVFVGFDGTVDHIVDVVDKRKGAGENYEAIAEIAQFGERIKNAAGKSTNIELFLKRKKAGGNAAIMSCGLVSLGLKTTLLADLGKPKINPVFEPLAKQARLISIGNPTDTHALEFSDGKIMLCYTRNHETITYENILKAVGGEGRLKKELTEASLVSLVNWTMTPGMTGLLKSLVSNILPRIKSKDNERIYFFDLSDPEKRPQAELKEVLEVIGQFSKFGKVVLGVNFKEAQQVAAVLGLGSIPETKDGVKAAARAIKEKLGIDSVAIHLTLWAVLATNEGEFYAEGHKETPKIKTGAGDHFNAGLATGLLMGVPPQTALTLSVTVSGFYVKEGRSPTLEDVFGMLERGW